MIPFLKGPEWNLLPEPVRRWFAESRFRVGSRSDRIGIRLRAASAAAGWEAPSIGSCPVCPGVIQLPPNGEPILLMNDAQTLGGYPRVGVVRERDLGLAAHVRPGDVVGIEPVM